VEILNSLPILPTISTSFIVISAILVAIGWSLIAKRNIEGHKKVMFFAGVFALSFFIVYATRTIFIGNTSFGGPKSLKLYYHIFLFFHIFLATTGGVFGLVSIISGFKNKLKLHKKIGPITSIIWFFTAITGVVVYCLLYVFYKGGDTTSVIKAVLGF
jgi:putative membrane protein